nr:NAD(P)H-binding protein [Nakamurella flava]
MSLSVLVTGASGFVGSRLAPQLVEAGHDVRAMTRHPDDYDGAGTAVFGDVSDPDSLSAALDGVDVAYYFVHSLDSDDFVEKDAAAARAFGTAAAKAGVRQIIYLGGLGKVEDHLSDHLRSRREVEKYLGEGGVPVTVLRAAVVIGHGGISWEMTRQLVDHLPAMVAPKWVKTKTQPVALRDVLRYLVGVLDNPAAKGRIFEIGGPEVLCYADMLKRVAAVSGKRVPPILPVPLLTPRLSSLWLSLVTDVDQSTARNLIDSMNNEVVVTDHSILDVVPGEPMGYDEAVRVALAERAADPAVQDGDDKAGRSAAAAGGSQR